MPFTNINPLARVTALINANLPLYTFPLFTEKREERSASQQLEAGHRGAAQAAGLHLDKTSSNRPEKDGLVSVVDGLWSCISNGPSKYMLISN